MYIYIHIYMLIHTACTYIYVHIYRYVHIYVTIIISSLVHGPEAGLNDRSPVEQSSPAGGPGRDAPKDAGGAPTSKGAG